VAKVKLRLHIFYDYEADPRSYETDDPLEIAEVDYRMLTEDVIGIAEFLEGEGRLSFAIEPLQT